MIDRLVWLIFLPDCVRQTRWQLFWMNNADDEFDEDICCVCIKTGERISGCSRIFGALCPTSRSTRLSFVFEVFIVNKRRWSSSSSADGFIVTSGCSKIRSSLWEVVNCRVGFDDDNNVLHKKKAINDQYWRKKWFIYSGNETNRGSLLLSLLLFQVNFFCACELISCNDVEVGIVFVVVVVDVPCVCPVNLTGCIRRTDE